MKRKAIEGIAITAVAIALVTGVFSLWRFIKNDNLNTAARSGDLSACKELISEGADVNGRGMHAMVPIMSAAEGGHPAVVEYLIATGADVNGHNQSGSALMWAIEAQNEGNVRTLLAHGVDANWRNHMGEAALDQATAKGLENIVKLLRQTTTPAEQD